jgi:hypothetical protein
MRVRLCQEIFEENVMRTQSAALGRAAAAAFSSAATALPCGETALGKTTTSEFTRTVSDKASSPLAHDQQGEPGADAPQDGSRPPLGQSAPFLEVGRWWHYERCLAPLLKVRWEQEFSLRIDSRGEFSTPALDDRGLRGHFRARPAG